MKRQAALCCMAALIVLVGGCAANEQTGDGVALMREVMIESAKAAEGRQPVESPERAIRAVRDWRGAQGDGGEAG